ncbi:MAG: YdcF family protein, partial [Alphaproteobacteria bacterium]|nr:YdcF family protein [Alphaproteobacteria bacterium]
DVMRDVLLRRGIPAAAILVEDKAANSGENAVFSRALLEKTFGAGNVKSVLAVGHLHAARRFLMTLEMRWPQAVKMFSSTNCFKAPENLWYTDPVFQKAVLAEYAKIAPYKAQGFIAEIDLDKMKRQIAALPQPASRREFHGGPNGNRRLY